MTQCCNGRRGAECSLFAGEFSRLSVKTYISESAARLRAQMVLRFGPHMLNIFPLPDPTMSFQGAFDATEQSNYVWLLTPVPDGRPDLLGCCVYNKIHVRDHRENRPGTNFGYKIGTKIGIQNDLTKWIQNSYTKLDHVYKFCVQIYILN